MHGIKDAQCVVRIFRFEVCINEGIGRETISLGHFIEKDTGILHIAAGIHLDEPVGDEEGVSGVAGLEEKLMDLPSSKDPMVGVAGSKEADAVLEIDGHDSIAVLVKWVVVL